MCLSLIYNARLRAFPAGDIHLHIYYIDYYNCNYCGFRSEPNGSRPLEATRRFATQSEIYPALPAAIGGGGIQTDTHWIL